ncbi:uncharacterized protein MONOS_15200 [Monocercomonoides exilis]|uniref:uncharacterized protein n=1 Tax=Monocercomonoides exilis TaxID=2049356 RepID=UPI0035595AFE|nr:hypothetical protein MONOS_15200 [Monocercomonoides exilis]|eukprot:MONOS_15200.1-p1 / transcript=MONOS_15200.1 / gene=MONOS_15200 / organism=Monocercomonoides_exilis_PA203 / gene_product=unspecified product / transcript_product=unspecified product / location=Mono_scaffold01169:4542-5039(-) / protein_length=166 / sequence_SO=supercontig / SO=protein_coding / is_pseudo=false
MYVSMVLKMAADNWQSGFTPSSSCGSCDSFVDDGGGGVEEEDETTLVAKIQQVELTKERFENQYQRKKFYYSALIECRRFFLGYVGNPFGCIGEGVGRDARECGRTVPFVSANVIECTDSFESASFAAALKDVCVHPVCVEKATEMRGGRASVSIRSMTQLQCCL